MLRRGRYKLNYSWGDPVELYDLIADPGEFHDLAHVAGYQDLVADMTTRLLSHWDPAALDRQVRASQRRQKYIEDRSARAGATQPRADSPGILAKIMARG